MYKKNTQALAVLFDKVKSYGPLNKWKHDQIYEVANELVSNTQVAKYITSDDMRNLKSWIAEGSDDSRKAHKIMQARNAVRIKNYLMDNYAHDLDDIAAELSKIRKAKSGLEVMASVSKLVNSNDFSSLMVAAKDIVYSPEVLKLVEGDLATTLDTIISNYDTISIVQGSEKANSYINHARMKNAILPNYMRKEIVEKYLPELRKVYGKSSERLGS